MDLTHHAKTFDRAAATYDRVDVEFFATFGRMLVDAVALRPGERVLDIGTGRGAVLDPASSAVGPTGLAVGVDLAPTMVALTAADLADREQVLVRQEDATSLPTSLGTFDAVLSSLVLFFSDDPAGTLQHWASFVRPGGRLGLVTFVEDPDDSIFEELLTPFLPDDAQQEPAVDRSSFDLVRDAGWLDGAVRDAGLTVISATEHRHLTRFADIEQWWEWVWSHGMRAALELVPARDHDALREAAGRVLQDRRLPDGDLGLGVRIRITVANRAS
ncbi:class I SAM-dependent methyltransferase [Euzebya tangerina]|uniref:class I SAM-dependent methyltransferase n=1 Tax=Euzebya tangerina TaxID=591198 RepID=UPI001F0C1BDD|nr:methyltransferase domain-containing protein [Euzebya tangerina]